MLEIFLKCLIYFLTWFKVVSVDFSFAEATKWHVLNLFWGDSVNYELLSRKIGWWKRKSLIRGDYSRLHKHCVVGVFCKYGIEIVCPCFCYSDSYSLIHVSYDLWYIDRFQNIRLLIFLLSNSYYFYSTPSNTFSDLL